MKSTCTMSMSSLPEPQVHVHRPPKTISNVAVETTPEKRPLAHQEARES